MAEIFKETPSSEASIIPGYSSIQEFSQEVLKKVVQATQHANALSTSSDDHEYWNSFTGFQEFCQGQGTRIIQDIGRLLHHQAVPNKFAPDNVAITGLQSIDIDERFERLVEANDFMLENVSALLDEAAGVKKNDQPILPPSMQQSKPVVSSWNRKSKDGKSGKKDSFKLLMAKNIVRPQLKWIDKVDNTNTPFIPKLKAKPNALKPYKEDDDRIADPIANLIHQARVGGNDDELSSHPYAYELEQFEPSEDWLTLSEPQMYHALDETPLIMVDNVKKLHAMMKQLKEIKEIAVDLEHHSYRSFQGFVCLMQISTRDIDFIVDTLCLREDLHILNEVFTDPNILKVLHGSDHDIGWLQRDFGVYVVNMFDTGQAARTLQEGRFSLAHLLKKYCNVEAQKQFQLADWRIRPLPDELIRYAREDTHYLLYVKDCMRNALIEQGNKMKNLIRSVYSKSTSLCQTLYEKPIFLPESYMDLYQKYRGRLNPQQLECFRLIYGWRDKTAREEDESMGYTLPNHMLFQIAENLPNSPPGVLACCNPVPPLIRQRVVDVHRLVLQAREFDPKTGAQEAENNDTVNEKVSTTKDLSPNTVMDSIWDDGRTAFEIYPVFGPPVKRREPLLTVFDGLDDSEMTPGQKKAQLIWSTLKSPFESYLPNTGRAAVHPTKINEAWKEASIQKKEETVVKDQLRYQPGPTSGKRKAPEPPSKEMTLRDMIPKQKKKAEQDQEYDPVNFVYEKTVKQTVDYVPFDYSKADKKKFAAGSSSKNDIVDLTQTVEEPVHSGPLIKTKVHSKSGERSMMFK